MSENPWNLVLARIRRRLDAEEFRRWFSGTHYAADSGDQITVWVHTEAIRRHIIGHFQRHVDDALHAIGRGECEVRFVVTGVDDDEIE